MATEPLGKYITPSEAYEASNRFRAAANDARIVSQKVAQVGMRLDESWIGNAKNIFDSHFNSLPSELAAYADMLDRMAHDISNIEVWVEIDEQG